MSDTGPVMRGCRPSRILSRDNDGECEVIRLANLERYILRANAGLPIFEDPPSMSGSLARRTPTRRQGM